MPDPAEPAAESDAPGTEAEEALAVQETEQQVVLQRTVRYGRLLIGGAVIGALVGMLLSLLFPVAEDAEYTMGQAVGFMAVIGGAIGLGLGGVLALLLGLIAKRQRGTGIAIQADVR